MGDFIKGGASVYSPTSDDHISQLQKDGIWAVCTHMYAYTLCRRKRLGRGQEERQRIPGI